jgi:hypothetical protein
VLVAECPAGAGEGLLMEGARRFGRHMASSRHLRPPGGRAGVC